MRPGTRGQTTQDFAVGISVFLLTIAFVFAFIPTIFTPFDTDVEAGDTSNADRVASTFVENLSVEREPGTLDAGASETFFDTGSDGDGLRSRYSLSTVTRVNVTVRSLDSQTVVTENGVRFARGDDYDGQPSASASRVVTFGPGDQGICSPACRLVVRVW